MGGSSFVKVVDASLLLRRHPPKLIVGMVPKSNRTPLELTYSKLISIKQLYICQPTRLSCLEHGCQHVFYEV